jgi:TRAP transporter TAXI family solute receptor
MRYIQPPNRNWQKERQLRQLLTFLTTIFAIALLSISGCKSAEKNQPTTVVRMATILGRIMTPLAAKLTKVLPEHFPATIEVQKLTNSGDYPLLLETGQIELGMIQTDLAYAAYTQGLGDSPQPMKKLRGVAVLYTTPLHLLAAESSGIKSVSDLKGKRVFAGAEGSTTEAMATISLRALGLSLADTRLIRIADERIPDAFRSGELDAAFYRGNDPYPLIQEMLKAPGVTFVPLAKSQVETIRAYHPFFHATSIPAGIYGDNPEVETIGGDMLLACRDDLPGELVYWITRTLFESLPELADSLPALRRIDPEHVQASPVPLHEGAARFYRERELFP